MNGFKCIFLAGLFLCAALEAKWHDHYLEAKNQAVKEGKPLLIAFLGSNWCPWSDQLESEVLANPNFLREMEKDFVLVKIDIPENFEEENFPGKELKKRFKVEESPSLILMQPTDEEIAILEYLPVDVKEFCSYVKETLSDYQRLSRITKKQLDQMQVEELKALYAKAGRLADQTFKKIVLEQGLKSDQGPFFLLEKYEDLIAGKKPSSSQMKHLRKKIIQSDPKNEGGALRKLAVMDFQALANVKKKTPKAEIVVRPLLEYLQAFGKNDGENAWRIEMKVSQYFFTQNRIEDALKHAQASLEIAPEECKKEIAQSIEYLKSYNNR